MFKRDSTFVLDEVSHNDGFPSGARVVSVASKLKSMEIRYRSFRDEVLVDEVSYAHTLVHYYKQGAQFIVLKAPDPKIATQEAWRINLASGKKIYVTPVTEDAHLSVLFHE